MAADGFTPAEIPLPCEQRGAHSWALLFCISVVLLVCIRFFSEKVRLLPGMVQYIDIPLTVLVGFLTILALARRGFDNDGLRLRLLIYLFFLVFLVSWTANTTRVSLFPAAMFIFGFLSPLVFSAAAINARLGRDDVSLIMRTFFWLGLLQLVVGIFWDFPQFLITDNPDVVSGTFGQNPYQFTYFLGLWLLYVLGGTVIKSGKARRGQGAGIILSSAAVFVLFYAAQYRAMVIFFTLVILFTFWVSPAKLSSRALTSIGVIGVSMITLLIVSTTFPNLKLLRVFDLLQDTTPLVQSGKLKAVNNMFTMYGDIPHTALVGSGPGTYSSRAYVTFAEEPMGVKANVNPLVSSLLGGRAYGTDVANRYIQSLSHTAIQGGNTAASYESSYTSLAAETGPLGLTAYLAAYVFALRFSYRRLVASAKARDNLGVRIAFVCLGGLMLLLIQSLFDNWLENTRVTIPLWILIGALYALKFAEPATATPLQDPPEVALHR
jgi:hypothetical protein